MEPQHPEPRVSGWQRLDTRQRVIAGLILLAALLVRLALAPSYGYHGIEGDLIEQKQSIHRALTMGVHEVYMNL